MVIVDAIDTPTKKSLKKGRKTILAFRRHIHTFKVQAIIHYRTQKIISLCMIRRAVHNFEFFKRNLNQILVDKDYRGI